ncbi:MAG: L-aspartate oxidase [bacterium]
MKDPVDILVIGSGIAGLSFALKAAEHGRVAVVTKKEHRDSATNYAQGGIAAVLSPLDDFDSHIQDTLEAGAGLCRREVVEPMVRAAPALISELLDLGVSFTRDRDAGDPEAPDGGAPLDLGREGGHSHPRIVHAKDLTGREVEQALVRAVTEHPDIRVYEDHVAVELITEHHLDRGPGGPEGQPTVFGAYVLERGCQEVTAVPARLTLLATGGVGQVYRHTTNPDIATGDGLAMTARADGTLANLEFMQFHPTSLYGTGDPAFLISEAVRGFGGILRNQEGEAFMEGVHPLKDLAPRDVVARAIDRQLKASGAPYVHLDLTHRSREEIEERFPHITEMCGAMGLDPASDPLPVVPAAHYMCGGIPTDTEGRTGLDRLFAVGETACTGVHGANRLASNSLLEGLFFADRAARAAGRRLEDERLDVPDVPSWDPSGTRQAREAVLLRHDRDEIRDLMWDYVGLVRSRERLKRAEGRLALIAREVENFYKYTRVTMELLELRNLAQVGLLIARSALKRRESRGLHFILDHPEKDPELGRRDTSIELDWEIEPT